MVIKKIRNCAETTKLKQTTKLASMVTIQLSKTLSSLFEVFLATKKFCLAKLAAYWGLWMALRFDRHFSILARNFANVFKIISSNHSRDNHSWITKIAFREISRSIFFDGVDMEGLTAVVRMYTGIMMCQ